MGSKKWQSLLELVNFSSLLHILEQYLELKNAKSSLRKIFSQYLYNESGYQPDQNMKITDIVTSALKKVAVDCKKIGFPFPEIEHIEFQKDYHIYREKVIRSMQSMQHELSQVIMEIAARIAILAILVAILLTAISLAPWLKFFSWIQTFPC